MSANFISDSSDISTYKSQESYRRIVVKAGTSLLTSGTDSLNLGIMSNIVGQIAYLHCKGAEILLVSSGAVAAGRNALELPQDSKDISFRQVLAAVGQGRLMHVYQQLFESYDIRVGQALLSRKDLSDRLGYLNVRNTLLALLEHKIVPIINENDVVSIDELIGEGFGDNDTLSALVANLVDADLLVMLGEVDGLFTSDPNIDPKAKLVQIVDEVNQDVESMGGPSRDGRGRGGMTTKIEASRIAAVSGVDVVIANGQEEDVVRRLIDGESIGTFFPASRTKMESRKRWMLSGLSTKGEILVDDGAVRAICTKHRSLLPAGVIDITGSFDRGEIVSILDTKGKQIAAGITNYSSEDLSSIKGLHSENIENILQHSYGEEAVHRSNMVIV